MNARGRKEGNKYEGSVRAVGQTHHSNMGRTQMMQAGWLAGMQASEQAQVKWC